MSFEYIDIGTIVMNEALRLNKSVCVKYNELFFFTSCPVSSREYGNSLITVSKSWAENFDSINYDNSKTFYYGPDSEDFDEYILKNNLYNNNKSFLPEGMNNYYKD